MRKVIIIAVCALLPWLIVDSAFTDTYRAVVAQLSPAASAAYSNVVTQLFKEEGAAVTPQIVPFARCVYLVGNKQADLLYPLIANPDKAKWNKVKFDYSLTVTHKIVFVLYSNKGKRVSVAELKKGNARRLVIETDAAHTDYFSFAVSPSASIDGSLKKVDKGQIDGYIFAQNSTDALLKKLALKNIKREYFDIYDCGFGIAKGTRGGALDKVLAGGLAKMKTDGQYQKLLGPTIKSGSTYIDWQP